MGGFIGGVLVLGSLGFFLVSIFALFRPLPKLGLRTRGRAALAMLACFFSFAAGGMLLPQPPASAAPTTGAQTSRAAVPSKPASLADASKTITGVRIVRHNLLVEATLDAAYTDGLGTDAANVVQPLLTRFQKGAPEDTSAVKLISVTFVSNGMDRLGAPTKIALMTMDFRADDVRAAHLDRLGWFGAMNLATNVAIWRPEMRQGVLSWCKDSARFAPAFCAGALS